MPLPPITPNYPNIEIVVLKKQIVNYCRFPLNLTVLHPFFFNIISVSQIHDCLIPGEVIFLFA